MKALLSLLLVLLFLFSPSTEAGQCGQGVQVAGGCACYSGYTNQFCAVDELSSSGCTLTNVSPLTTESVAELLTSPPYTQVLANSFTFTLASPGRLNRYFESIMLAGNDSCSYPSSHFTHSFNNLGSQAYTCNDAYTGMFTIPEVSACGFLESSDADFTILSGSISVVVKDDLGMFRSTAISRTTSSSLSVELKFPSHYTVSSGNLTVVSPINVLAAVTYQEFDPMNDQLTLKITTSVQWPYFLSVPTLVFSPDSSYVVTGPTIVDTSCDPNSGDCLQETTVSFTNITAAGVCSITDQVFPFDWNYACRGDPKECPVNGINSIPQVDTHITTGELCSSLAVVSNLRGDLTSHSSNAFGPTTIAYLANSPVFVLATMTSDVNIQAVEVVQVIIHYGGNSYTIVSGGSPQSGFGALNYQIYTAGLSSNQVGFSFDATYAGDSAIFISLGENIFVFTVEVQVQITYITSFKRDVVVEGMTLSKDLVLDATRI